MSVRKRGANDYHYDFQQSGKRYWGVCEGCTTKAEALAYEKHLRDTAKEAAAQKSVGALVENFKRELTGGDKITIAGAFDLYMSKPRRKQPSEQ